MNRYFQNVFSGVNFILAMLLVWFLVKALLQFWQVPHGQASVSLPALNMQSYVGSMQSSNLQGSLFGMQASISNFEKDNIPKETAQQIDDLDKTRLNLTLKGTIITPEKSVALIQKARDVLVLRVDESLSRDVTVHAIQDTFVVLENKGKLEKLMLPGMKDSKSSFLGKNRIHSAALTSDQQRTLEEVRRKVKTSPLAINRYIRIRTLQKNGKIQSLQLWPRREKAIFDALGFQAGDHLTAINGKSIADIASDMSQWQSMMNLSQAQFTVRRNGALQTIDVNLQ